MSIADKMFEKLGYYTDFGSKVLEYRREKDGDLEEINIWLEDKTISKNYYGDIGYITIEELKAINKKIDELGW